MRRSSFVVVASVLMLSIVNNHPAAANQIVGATGDTGCNDLNIHDPSDPVIGYQRSGLSAANHSQVEWIMLNRVLPTDLEVGAASSGDFIYYNSNYTTFCGKNWWSPGSSGVVGFAKCDALVGAACDTHKVYLHLGYTNTLDTAGRRKLICHETGHSIGITHNDHTTAAFDSCMKTPASDAGTSNFSTHEINDMINYVW
jgi:hypothetical protein